MGALITHGKAVKRTGLVLLITGVVLGTALQVVPASEFNNLLVVVGFLPIVMILGGAFLLWRGRQYVAKTTAAEVLGDSKPDVLYLRSFRTDPSAAGYVFGAMLTPRLMSGMATDEEQLGEVLRPFGDLVALGRPGEALPTPGASRLYASEAEWRNVVTDQMKTARLVVIRAGGSASLLWELGQAIRVVNPEKLLILMLGMKKKHYDTFRKEAEQVIGCACPEANEIRRFGMVSGFMRFSSNWEAQVLPLRMPYFRRSVYKPYRRLFQFTLKPVFEDNDLEWRPPPVSMLTVTSVTMMAVVVSLLLLIVVNSCN